VPAPLVVISAAMAVPSGYYRPLLSAFAERGWEAHAMPTRGFERGEPAASREHDWSYETEVDAIAAVVDAARAEQPDRPVILLGHSLGAQLGTMHELHRTPCDGFVTVGGGVPHFRAYPYGGLPVLFMGLAVPVATRMFGFLPRPFFGAPGASTLMRQWARFVRTGRPPFAVDEPVRTPTLVIALQGDALAVRSANDVFVQRFLDPAATTRWTYRRCDTPPGGTTDHIAWVKHPHVVVDHIVGWFEARGRPRPTGREG
jgi:predicted alpha/beta hydrolase